VGVAAPPHADSKTAVKNITTAEQTVFMFPPCGIPFGLQRKNKKASVTGA
jgi:hypothetical protein